LRGPEGDKLFVDYSGHTMEVIDVRRQIGNIVGVDPHRVHAVMTFASPRRLVVATDDSNWS
jgi:hypothetical protein